MAGSSPLSVLWDLLQVQEQIVEYASMKQNKDLKKGDGAKRGRVTGVASCDELHHAPCRSPGPPV